MRLCVNVSRFYENLLQAVAARSKNDSQVESAPAADGRRKKSIRKNETHRVHKATATVSAISTDELSQKVADEVNFEDCNVEYVFREENLSINS